MNGLTNQNEDPLANQQNDREPAVSLAEVIEYAEAMTGPFELPTVPVDTQEIPDDGDSPLDHYIRAMERPFPLDPFLRTPEQRVKVIILKAAGKDIHNPKYWPKPWSPQPNTQNQYNP